MMRRTRDELRQHNRNLLIEAAEAIFAQKGVAGASLDDVALRAGLTKGAVYSNFRSKGELILEVIKQRQRKTLEAQEFNEIRHEQKDDRERLLEWCDLWIKQVTDGKRNDYARLIFEFIPLALQEPDLKNQFLEYISPRPNSETQSPLPPNGPVGSLPVEDQFRILVAIDIGLAFLMLFDKDNVSPDLYKSTLLALSQLEA
ncbi:TetR/AcrR family transcriptional regulator [Corynebacterium felinum]|uniref:AcrR family transcriptional regulator n=2 Tax=Corynebacterium felinum TaxID=131318 RepID=A0ABU2B8G9_9CORY|nr:TetR/AcrR family transcriptional regulator [Corynebacterium felinum]MDF5820263.1 TetR/AcrR family transcriptional regulator [Corynebacterium felinum]MDR7354908.1 AcrR family transcriptional regulator [Corynebacterium felinum]